jgi:hypothetical protein
MGGGPSREEQRQQQLLQQQQQQALTQQNQFFTQAATPDPLAERMRTSRLKWLDDTEGKNGPLDVGKLEGMAPYLDLYNRARAKREGERVGIGALKMGLDASSPELAARIAEQRDTERQQEAAGGLENAFRTKDAEMKDSVMPLIGMRQQKDMGLASLASSNSNSARDAYLQMLLRPKKTPFWQSMLAGGMQAGATLGAAAI